MMTQIQKKYTWMTSGLHDELSSQDGKVMTGAEIRSMRLDMMDFQVIEYFAESDTYRLHFAPDSGDKNLEKSKKASACMR